MATNITIPKLGMTMKEATLVEWKFQEGQAIKEGDVVLIIETEKVQWDVEASASGFIHIITDVQVTEPIGTVVGLIAESEDELAGLQKDSPAPAAAAAAPAAGDKPAAKAAKAPASAGGRVKASPIAKKMAEEHGIDLSTVAGTGPGGRIKKEDVEAAIEAAKSAPPAAAGAAAPTGEMRDGKQVKEVIKLTGMRKTISDHMQRSLAVSAQLTSMGELECTNLKSFRAKCVEMEEALGTRITYNDIYVLAAAKALKAFPTVNASLVDNEIILWEDINVGVAVALSGADVTGGGLIVPVIKNADRKSLSEISKETKEIVQRAREGNLMPDDVTGGTFTITNMGGMGGGWGYGTPIINQPQSAIIGTGAIVDRPMARDGQVVILPMMPLSFTFDHRVLDGVPAGMFMGYLSKLLSDPQLLAV